MSDSLRSELMTAERVAALMHMKRTTIEDYARRGLLPRRHTYGCINRQPARHAPRRAEP